MLAIACFDWSETATAVRSNSVGREVRTRSTSRAFNLNIDGRRAERQRPENQRVDGRGPMEMRRAWWFNVGAAIRCHSHGSVARRRRLILTSPVLACQTKLRSSLYSRHCYFRASKGVPDPCRVSICILPRTTLHTGRVVHAVHARRRAIDHMRRRQMHRRIRQVLVRKPIDGSSPEGAPATTSASRSMEARAECAGSPAVAFP